MLWPLFCEMLMSIQDENSVFTFRSGFSKEFTLKRSDKYLKQDKFSIISYAKQFFERKDNKNNSQKEWYYVHFLTQNISSLYDIMKKLDINEKNEIIKNTYTLFISKEQLEKLTNISLFKKIEPHEKIIQESYLIDETDHFLVMTIPQYKLISNKNYIVEKQYGEDIFLINIVQKDNNMKHRIIIQLSKIPEIKSIITHKKPQIKNSIATGFTQKNNYNFSYNANVIGKLDRYLNNNGLNGEGQLVTVFDTPVDFYHPMFRDDNVHFEVNKYMPNHRKIIYYYHNKDMEDLLNIMDEGEHGTHVSGTVAGKSLCENDQFGFSDLNGNAPEAKILYAGWIDLESDYAIIEKLMNKYHSNISTNSWGSTDYDSSYNQIYGELAQRNPQSVFIYASGNEYDLLGNFSVCDPGGSKNVLTVGASSSFYDDYPSISIMKSLKYEDAYIYLSSNPIFYYRNLLITGAVGTDPSSADIVFIDFSKGNQCNLIEDGKVYILYGLLNETASFWITECNFSILKDFYYFDGNESIINALLQIGGNFTIRNIFFPLFNESKRTTFSSTGPGNKGILKPDVMAPGENIISANSKAHSNSPYGCGENSEGDYVFKSGSSMATPNIGGGMALVHQYFNSGRWIKKVYIDGSTSRALIINSCTHPFGSKVPDIIYGHGIVDLSTILPVENDFGVQITPQNTNDKHSVKENGHVLAKLKVNKSLSKKKLQITLSYIDPMLSIESPIPITRDLDLIVVSPSKKIFIGDHLASNDTQHASTNEKIIINESEVENGVYTVHVYAGAFVDNMGSDTNQRQNFSVVATGPIENGFLEFEDSNECPCDKCNPNRPGYCICNETKNIGQTCQVNIETFKENNGSLTVGPLEVKRARFISDKNIISLVSKSANPGRSSTVWVSKSCHLSIGEYEINGATGNETETNKTINIDFKSNEICVAIFNFNDVEATYNIEITVDSTNNNKPSRAHKLGMILAFSIIPVCLIIIIILIIVCCKKCKCCKRNDKYEKSLLTSDLISSNTIENT